MNILRREFLKGTFSAIGLAAFADGRLFAAPEGWKHGGTPNLVFGVLSDTHFRTDSFWRRGIKSDKYFVAALECFRDMNVDAVVHCGDMADRGLVGELQLHADAWHKVFPKNMAPDGHVVEKLFVTGNHDIEAWGRNFNFARVVPNKDEWPRKIIKANVAEHWERIWGEKYEPVWHKEVKGYHFFGRNWGVGLNELKDLIDANRAGCGLDTGAKPFFFMSHNMPRGKFNSEMKRYRNALSFWGHWHVSAANWTIIKMLNANLPGVQCPACPSWWRKDGKWMGGCDGWITKAPIEGKLQGGQWHQGFVVKVYDDALVIERREFSKGGSVGPDWVMPFPENCERGTSKRHPFARGELKKKIGNPQFRQGAKLTVLFDRAGKGGKPAKRNPAKPADPVLKDSASQLLCVKIPLADGNAASRVYAYEVEVSNQSDKLLKAVYAAGCNMGIGHEPDGGITTLEIPGSELPPGKMLTVSVSPLSSLGTRGRAIVKKLNLYE